MKGIAGCERYLRHISNNLLQYLLTTVTEC